ncbi:MAG: HDOD domain-containing protein [Planctomycetota bacterium]
MDTIIYKANPGIGDVIQDMPAVSPIVGKMTEISHEMDTSARDLVKIIMIDPVLTGKVLRLVNSSFYGLSQSVNSLAQAIVLLGVNTVKSMALSTAVVSTLFHEEEGFPLTPQEFWRHSLAVAVGAKLLAKERKVTSAELETYFVAGLLHDIGKILFIRTEPARYRRAIEEAREFEVSLPFAEIALLGYNHCRAGRMLARHWKLDPTLSIVIERHHRPDTPPGNPLLEIVVVANAMAKRAGLGSAGNPVIEEWADGIAAREGISESVIAGAAEALPRELEKAEVFLKLAQEAPSA